MGIHLNGHAHVRVDNMSVVKNTSVPESTLKKKLNAIAYHFVREAVASGIIRIAYEPTGSNMADILAKLSPGPTTLQIIGTILYRRRLVTMMSSTCFLDQQSLAISRF
jgi:hypothetical protein